MPPEKTGNLTEFEKGQIVALKEKCLSFSEIGKILSRPRSTVLSFYNRFQKRGDVKNLPMPGRHKIIDTRTHRRLVRESKKARRLPLSELRNEVAPHASVKTINRALASVNIKKWRARKRAFLKDEHAVKKLAWAKKYNDWTQEDFEGVCNRLLGGGGINRVTILSLYQSAVYNETKYRRLRLSCCNKLLTISQLPSSS